MAKAKPEAPKRGHTRMAAYRLTEAEAESIGRIANAIERKTGVPVTKTDVLRAGLRLMAARWLEPPVPTPAG